MAELFSLQLQSMSKYISTNLQVRKEKVSNVSTKEITEVQCWQLPPNASTDNLIDATQPNLLRQLVGSLLACWICLPSGASLSYFTTAVPSLRVSLNVSDTDESWIPALTMLGAMVGGLMSGPCISLGRRKALWIVAPPLVLAWTIIIMARGVTLFSLAHVLFGMCMGVINEASQLFVSESASPQYRGALGCVPSLTFNIGFLLGNVAGTWLDWQKMAMLGVGLSVPAMFTPLALHETPAYLVAKGLTQQAEDALHWLRGENCDISAEYNELLKCEKGPGLLERLRELGNIEIFQPLVITSVIRVLSRFCGLRAILTFISDVIDQSKSSLDKMWAPIISGGGQLAATLVACVLLDRLGRCRLMVVSQAVISLSLTGLGCYLFYGNCLNDTQASTLGWIPITAIIIYIVAYQIGLGPVSGIIVGEMIPQRHRSVASSITGAISWLSAFVVTKTFADLKMALQTYGTMWLYAGLCVAGVVFVLLFVPETRGISQYEIEVLFKRDVATTTSKKNTSRELGLKTNQS